MTQYAAKCPHCAKAQAVDIKDKKVFRLRCRSCRKQTKFVQFPKDGLPFEAFLIKGPYDNKVTPKAVAAWNRRTFGPKGQPSLDTLDKYLGG